MKSTKDLARCTLDPKTWEESRTRDWTRCYTPRPDA